MIDPNSTIWVIDTSSLINVKELVTPEHRQSVFNELTNICNEGRILFPPEVLAELKNGAKAGRPDLPLDWAKQNRKLACRFGRCNDELSHVMNDPVAQLTPDPNQTDGEDDADPHVLATALKAVSLVDKVVVVTQESRKHPPQVALNVAAGSLGFPSINLYVLLIELGIWKDELTNR
ncbi:MAG: DUF4411 family protein [Gammaproteobacteria bacterium]|nr:DUF4411 family protein [Gammaproteobacteria bacterium]